MTIIIKSRRYIPVLTTLFSLLFMISTASALPEIMSFAESKGIRVTSCLTCHTSPFGGIETLRPNYLKAYEKDPIELSLLKNLINGCPTGQAINTSTLLCEKLNTVSGTLGLTTSGAAKSDVYAVTCGQGTAYLSVSVRDDAPLKPALVTIQAVKNAAVSGLSIDVTDGDTVYSSTEKLNGGAGVYWMVINKSASSTAGVEGYKAKFSCRNTAGAQTATTWVSKQNQ